MVIPREIGFPLVIGRLFAFVFRMADATLDMRKEKEASMRHHFPSTASSEGLSAMSLYSGPRHGSEIEDLRRHEIPPFDPG